MKKILFFGAGWCSPCANTKPLLDEITQFEVVKYDIDKDHEKTLEYSIRSVPTIVLLDDDGSTLVYRVGGMNRTQLQQFLAPYVKL